MCGSASDVPGISKGSPSSVSRCVSIVISALAAKSGARYGSVRPPGAREPLEVEAAEEPLHAEAQLGRHAPALRVEGHQQRVQLALVERAAHRPTHVDGLADPRMEPAEERSCIGCLLHHRRPRLRARERWLPRTPLSTAIFRMQATRRAAWRWLDEANMLSSDMSRVRLAALLAALGLLSACSRGAAERTNDPPPVPLNV